MIDGGSTRRGFLMRAGAAAPVGLLASALRITPAAAAADPATSYGALLEALAADPSTGIPSGSVAAETARFRRSLAGRDPAERSALSAMLESLEGPSGARFSETSPKRRLDVVRRCSSVDAFDPDDARAANVRALVEFARAPFCEGTFVPSLTFAEAS
jgi:hypothetical protein